MHLNILVNYFLKFGIKINKNLMANHFFKQKLKDIYKYLTKSVKRLLPTLRLIQRIPEMLDQIIICEER